MVVRVSILEEIMYHLRKISSVLEENEFVLDDQCLLHF